jgi:hypothetical protein
MPDPLSPDHLDLIPEPAEIHRRIAAAARSQRLLRRLLRLSLAARRESESVSLTPLATRASVGEANNASS